MDRREFVERSVGVAAAIAVPGWLAEAARAADPALRELARQLDGDVVVPGSARYASAKLLWNTRFDALRPRAVAYCADAADVQRVVRWGRKHHVRVVPRAGSGSTISPSRAGPARPSGSPGSRSVAARATPDASSGSPRTTCAD
jgi:hypothetical protein